MAAIDRQIQATAVETGSSSATLDDQTQAIAELAEAQANLQEDGLLPTSAGEAANPAVPVAVTLPADTRSDSPWIALTAGLAAGLALVAVLMTRTRRREDQVVGLDTKPLLTEG